MVKTTKSETVKNPMFLKFINKEIGVQGLLLSFSQTKDEKTSQAVSNALKTPPDLEGFRKELEEAVSDLAKDGVGGEFIAFVNNYMEPSLEEFLDVVDSPLGESRTQTAVVKDEDSTWIEGYICYNVCLYIKAFGLDDLKKCAVCGKLFGHKGKYAKYCADGCKSQSKKMK